MRRSVSRPRTAGLVAGLIAGTLLGACKPAARVASPTDEEGPVLDDIADVEAALEDNADELAAEGIYVARADAPPQAVQQRPPAPETEVSEPTAVPELDASEDEDAAVEAGVSPDASEKPRGKSREDFWSRWLEKRGRKKNEAERCQRVCDLAEATCELADRICELAQRHPDEVRYEAACDRAGHQCRVAAEACTACAG
jgi:hypothetical protein